MDACLDADGGTLYPHQMVTVQRMEEMENRREFEAQEEFPRSVSTETRMCRCNSRVGFLANCVGSGKTACVVSLLARDRMEGWDPASPPQHTRETSVGNGVGWKWWYRSTLVEQFAQSRLTQTTLVVVPAGSIPHWQAELGRASSRLKVLSLVKTRDVATLHTSPISLSFPPDAPEDLWRGFHVVLCSASRLSQLLSITRNRVTWKRVVVDDAATVKIPGVTKLPETGFTWLVNASPSSMARQVRRMYFQASIPMHDLGFKMPEFLVRACTVRLEDEAITASASLPEVENVHHPFESAFVQLVVREFVSPRVKELLDADDILGAVNELGSQVLSEQADRGSIIALVTQQKREELDDARKREDVDRQTMLEGQIRDLEERVSSALQTQACPICSGSLQDAMLVPCCQAIFCGRCIMRWVVRLNHSTCPLCRSSVSSERLTYLGDSTQAEPKRKRPREDGPSPAVSRQPHPGNLTPERALTRRDAALNAVRMALRKGDAARVLLFSTSDNTFLALANLLTESRIPFAVLKGPPPTRQRILANYNSGTCKLLLLNMDQGTSGLNLQATTDIVFYQATDEPTEAQVIGCARRIGKREPVTVHRLQEV